MSFRSQILERLTAIEEKLQSDRRAVPVLKEQVKDLKEMNSELLDRLMSRNFEELSISRVQGEHGVSKPYDVLSDDLIAGDIIDVPGS